MALCKYGDQVHPHLAVCFACLHFTSFFEFGWDDLRPTQVLYYSLWDGYQQLAEGFDLPVESGMLIAVSFEVAGMEVIRQLCE